MRAGGALVCRAAGSLRLGVKESMRLGSWPAKPQLSSSLTVRGSAITASRFVGLHNPRRLVSSAAISKISADPYEIDVGSLFCEKMGTCFLVPGTARCSDIQRRMRSKGLVSEITSLISTKGFLVMKNTNLFKSAIVEFLDHNRESLKKLPSAKVSRQMLQDPAVVGRSWMLPTAFTHLDHLASQMAHGLAKGLEIDAEGFNALIQGSPDSTIQYADLATVHPGELENESERLLFRCFVQSAPSVLINDLDGEHAIGQIQFDLDRVLLVPGKALETLTNGAVPAINHQFPEGDHKAEVLVFDAMCSPEVEIQPLNEFA